MLHAIYLDGREVHVVKPGIDEFKLTDLVPDHEYEVHVEARQSKDVHKKSNIRPATSRSLLFTTPKGGMLHTNCLIISPWTGIKVNEMACRNRSHFLIPYTCSEVQKVQCYLFQI